MLAIRRALLMSAISVAVFDVAVLFAANTAGAADWQPAAGPLMTRWAKDVSAEDAHPEYPRPQMVRPKWTNLNGLWEYAVRPEADAVPEKFDGQILVPFPIESALSGVMKRVEPASRVWYRRTIARSKDWDGKRVLLHFGAVNWETTVWLNGKELGQHRGGYDGFSFDITDALTPDATQQLVVAVWNPIDSSTQPRGKQVSRPGGIMYTPSTGIWQTVWLEAVPAVHIESLKIVPDVDLKQVRVAVTVAGTHADAITFCEVTATDGTHQVAQIKGEAFKSIELVIPELKLWSPDDPFLYGLKVRLVGDGKGADAKEAGGDAVESYFAMRKIAVAKDAQGINRIFLNNHPHFMLGPLDQGFWPDGLYTAPTDDALRYDIEATKKLGFNMARKHVKVEPDRWYYWCDKLGLLVWQDMPSGDRGIGGGKPDIVRSPESAKEFEQELKAMIDGRRNHPSIVMWVVFNEGWGQFDTARQTEWVKQYDPSRLVDCASGWQDRGVGDVIDMHNYPGPASPEPEEHRAAVLGEFGGLGLPVDGHTWQAKKNWGYRSFKDAASLTDAYVNLITRLRPLRSNPGLSAAVYTQTTDVETEVNGLMTYDRAVIKPDLERASAANKSAFLPPPIVTTVVPTSQRSAQIWRYTTTKPPEGWERPEFDDSNWKSGPGGFGTKGTPGAVVRTEWRTQDIWIRCTAELPAQPLANPHVVMHHDDDAEVYLNGVLAVQVTGYIADYTTFPIADAAVRALKPGKSTIAVHCHQYAGGQFIDAGLTDEREVKPAVEPTDAAAK
jgi:hypothetical protein